jgi:hypothetical protein
MNPLRLPERMPTETASATSLPVPLGELRHSIALSDSHWLKEHRVFPRIAAILNPEVPKTLPKTVIATVAVVGRFVGQTEVSAATFVDKKFVAETVK